VILPDGAQPAVAVLWYPAVVLKECSRNCAMAPSNEVKARPSDDRSRLEKASCQLPALYQKEGPSIPAAAHGAIGRSKHGWPGDAKERRSLPHPQRVFPHQFDDLLLVERLPIRRSAPAEALQYQFEQALCPWAEAAEAPRIHSHQRSEVFGTVDG
jgi:hypothetical protein